MLSSMGPMESAVESIEQAATFYIADLEALTEEQILGSAGGSARRPVDFTYEVALINRRIACRLREVEPPALPQVEGWLVAPPELESKIAIIAFIRSACEDLADSAKAIPSEEFGKLVGAAGKEEPAYKLANFASMHTMYHDAQLNFLQSLHGDSKIHWG